MGIRVTSLEQLEVGAIVERTIKDTNRSTYWKVSEIAAPSRSKGVLGIYGTRVRKSDHQTIRKGRDYHTENAVLVYALSGELNLENKGFTLTLINQAIGS